MADAALPAPRPCRLCGRPLIFARTAKGEVMPLDAKPTTVYVATEQPDLLGASELTLGDRVSGHVAHWATCPHADAFRSKGDRPPDRPPSRSARAAADED